MARLYVLLILLALARCRGQTVITLGGPLVGSVSGQSVSALRAQGARNFAILTQSSASYTTTKQDGLGTATRWNLPSGVAVNSSYALFVADTGNGRIRVIVNDVVTTLAGGGLSLVSNTVAANGVGTNALFINPYGLAINSSGFIYIAEGGHRIRLLSPSGAVTTLAGSGSAGAVDGTAATFNMPYAIALDSSNRCYIADGSNNKIRVLFTNLTVVTLAGGNLSGTTAGFADGVGTSGLFNAPHGVAIDSFGTVYVADTTNNKIRKISNGVVATLAGGGATKIAAGFTDGTGTNALFNIPWGVAVDASGFVFVSEQNKVRRISPSGTTITLAGPYAGGSGSGTNGIGTAATFTFPRGITTDALGNVFVADGGYHKIRAIVNVSCTAGNYVTLNPPACVPCLPGSSSATVASYFACPACAGGSYNVATGSSAACTLCPVGTFSSVLGAASLSEAACQPSAAVPQSVVTVAGGYATESWGGFSDGAGTFALFREPRGIVVNAAGVLFVSDSSNHRIRLVLANTSVLRLSGLGTFGAADGAASSAQFYYPYGIAVAANGFVYVADKTYHKIRLIFLNGTTVTLAGGATSKFATGAVDGIGSAALFSSPSGLTLDIAGNVYVADTGNNLIRRVSADGTVTTLAGGRTATTSGVADGFGTAALFYSPRGIAYWNGILFVSELNNHKIRSLVLLSGLVTTLAGGGIGGNTAGFNDAVGTAALFNTPWGIAVDAAGNVYVGDVVNNKVRKITPSAVVITIAGGSWGGMASGTTNGIGTASLFAEPAGIAVDMNGIVYVADGQYNHKIRAIFSFTCGPGQFITDNSPSASCAPCAAGSFASAVAHYRSCPLCPGSTYAPISGATTCTNFPPGIFSSAQGATNAAVNEVSAIVPMPVITFAGSVTVGSVDGDAMTARFSAPYGISFNESGIFYVSDNNNRLRTISLNGTVAALAGGGATGVLAGYADQVRGTNALFNNPASIAVRSNAVYVVDNKNNRIRAVTLDGTVTTVMGSAYGALDGIGTAATLAYPWGIAFNAAGYMFIADLYNHRVRLMYPNASVINYAGSVFGFNDGVGTGASFWGPRGIAVSPAGVVYVAELSSNKIRAIALDRTVTTIAGGGSSGLTAGYNDAIGTAALFKTPLAIAIDSIGNLYISDCGNDKIRLLRRDGTVITIAGGGATGVVAGAVNGIGTAALFSAPNQLIIDPAGNVYVAESNRIRMIANLTCAPGSYPTTSLTCLPCGPGNASAAATNQCLPCPAGSFSNASGATACAQCPGGHFCPAGSTSWNKRNCACRCAPAGSAAHLPFGRH